MTAAAHPQATWVRCTACDAGYYPAQRNCPACSTWDALRVEPLPRTGRLFTWTVVHVGAAAPPLPVPYALGYVDLDDGPRVLAPIVVDGDPDRELRHGLPLVLVAHDSGSDLPFHCEPAGMAGGAGEAGR
ncbi:hypothetical protein DSM112329_05363 [Paraconexibacter sp. AEG42_29]|uniref:ChsH2 C-terminal OB-fold domain-containing protein n=1 Tax=Paraconexibacter sp. AEG42_29 TaxID=2997339 RepID=A0AAU7B3K3_9ACTN